MNQLLSYGTYSAKRVRRFVGVNDPEGRLPYLAGGLTLARVISRLSIFLIGSHRGGHSKN